MEDSRAYHWRDVDEYGEDNIKIRALRWYVYTREKEYLIKRKFSVSVLHPKGKNIVWNCVKDDISRKMRTTKLLDYVDLIINYLKKMMMGGLERD